MPDDPLPGGSDPIRFHRLSDPYGAFTGFARFPVLIDGLWWPTSEHYFQAAKFPGTPHAETIRYAANPSEARRLGNTREVALRPDWRHERESVMRRATGAKFVQHPPLALMLLATGIRVLIEDTPGDTFWGDGGDGSGRNLNGIILMETRTRLRHALNPVLARSDPPGRDWVRFGDDLTVLFRADTPRRPVDAAWRLLQDLVDHPAPPQVDHGTATWSTTPARVQLRLWSKPPPDSRALGELLREAEITRVHQRHVRALRPRR